MTLMSGIALFIAMLISALIPGPSVMAVVSRSITSGVKHGLLVTLGIIIADYIFICLALSGLSAASSLLEELAELLKYLAGAYLLLLAYRLWRADIVLSKETNFKNDHLSSTLFSGVLLGLANPKAILFYMGFFPAFIELSNIRINEVVIILLIATIAVGGVLSVYACVGAKARHLFKGKKALRMMNRLSSGVLASCAVLLTAKA